MQTGSFNYNPESLNICDVVVEEIDFASNLWGKKNISIAYTLKTDNYVYADRNMVRTVFRNLLSNAIKFTPEKGSITMRSERVEKNGSFLKISIQDTGVGIPKDILTDLFTIKDNYSSEGTSGEEGSGMGLLFCKEFIDIQGGSIHAESIVGQGSIFSFLLPAVEK